MVIYNLKSWIKLKNINNDVYNILKKGFYNNNKFYNVYVVYCDVME